MVVSLSIEDSVKQLLIVLDDDIRRLSRTSSRLDELRSLVIKRDEAALASLLSEIETEAECHQPQRARGSNRQTMRKELADALGIDRVEEVTLSRLERVLPEVMAVQVTQRKSKLQSLVKNLRREYSATVLLLADCARFNRLLLESIFQWGASATVVYGSDGATRRQGGCNIVNLKF